MSNEEHFKRWEVPKDELQNLTPVKARDLVIQCFYQAQKETLSRASQKMGKTSNDEELYNQVKTIIKIVFREAGGDFDNPTKEVFPAVVEICAKKAMSWGTPSDIIGHHKKQIEKVLTLLSIRSAKVT